MNGGQPLSPKLCKIDVSVSRSKCLLPIVQTDQSTRSFSYDLVETNVEAAVMGRKPAGDAESFPFVSKTVLTGLRCRGKHGKRLNPS